MIFSVREVTHWYKEGEPVLRGLSRELPSGATVAILGPSGCGKSTLLNLLGLLSEQGVSEGSITFHGGGRTVHYDGLTEDRAARNALRAAEFGYVLQSCYLLPHFTGLENIAMPLMIRGRSRADALEAAEHLLTAVEKITGSKTFRDAAAKKPRQMSGGEKQRVAVLRSIVGGPRVVFADEPSSNLDAGNTVAFLNLLTQWRQGELDGRINAGRTLFLVCHHRETAKTYGDWFGLIEPGVPGMLFFPKSDWDQHEDRLERVLNPLALKVS